MDAMLVLKASLLLSVSLLAARLLRRAPAVARHRLWTAAFVALLALPLLAMAVPAIPMPVPVRWSAATPAPAVPSPESSPTVARGTGGAFGGASTERRATTAPDAIGSRASVQTTRASESGARTWPSLAAMLLAAWAIGATAAMAALLVSLWRVRSLTRGAETVEDLSWRRAADVLGARLGVRRPARLLISRRVGTPMAGGVWRRVIFLPAASRGWSAERRDVVLAHELAHLAGYDPLRHVAARVAVALYWFHPLAWLAARQSAVAREEACDEAVLALGTRPSAYAQVLLDLADGLRAPAQPLLALPMVDRSLLETRLMAILNHDIRPATRRTLLLPVLGVAVLTLSVAAAQPQARATSGLATPLASAPVAASAALATPEAIAAIPIVTSKAIALPPSAPVPLTQAGSSRNADCWSDGADGSSFNGTISVSDSGGRRVINEQIGTRGAGRIIQQRFDDLQVCMLAEGVEESRASILPSQWLDHARRIVLETRRGNAVEQLRVDRQGPGSETTYWRVGTRERPVDASVRPWRERLLAVLDTSWQLSALHGRVSSLRGEISSIHGQESSLRGQISSLQGEVSSMRGRVSSVRGEESSLRGEISSIQGHVSSLRGQISSEQGAISSLSATRDEADQAERTRIASSVSRHNAEITRIEQEIRDYNAEAKVAAVELKIKELDADGKTTNIDSQIRDFDLQGKTAAIERQIAALDVDGKVAAINKQIAALDADRKTEALEKRRDEELKQLESAIAAIR